jgi:hypothetical protein
LISSAGSAGNETASRPSVAESKDNFCGIGVHSSGLGPRLGTSGGSVAPAT